MTTMTHRTYWGVLAIVFVLVSGLFAQSRPTGGAPVARDLNATLADLLRTAPATDQDLSILQQQGGKLRRVTFWRGDKHKVQMTTALQRNLQFAVPNLVRDAQTSGGSISTTFALYKDLTVVCESLDSLLPSGSRDGRELAALNNDLSDMNRLREELSSYIQQMAASIESKNPQLVSSASRCPKKVIVYDNIPQKPSPKKIHPASQ